MSQAYRYALYLAPVGAWRELGQRWLGRCADTGATLFRPAGTDARQDAWTQAPRRYGLHATLKPPFRLRPGTRAADLDQAVRALAKGRDAFGIPLRREPLRGFLAWCIDDARASRRMNALADAAVAELDTFRAPPSASELARRAPRSLSPAQRQMLERWGYPYVFDTYTFHITLTGQLDASGLAAADTRLEALGSPALQAPMPVHAISLYVEPEAGADFIVARHYGFDGTCRDGAGARFVAGGAS
ncbi:DUF1045 domain-containing protein [Bordetella sp. BOR01]|uniref:DUF1045 domain-containing protein n=1 Tax=Bordetella sp. BOR01 TaxID=2854779 RepID=UPI001C4597B8|nr:DUF1045 domain-containing protein [Bordetella sp. BOR01]MBV7484157.1 DUF1045 domain-containing protein [Bordetella sp. BOR01]